jgi:ABC-type lipoprotein release transport system permease subunit
MGLVWVRGRSELRANWPGLLVLTLVLGIGGGVALGSLAGARRASTAMSRFVAYNRPGTGAVIFGNPFAPPPVPVPAAYSEAVPPYAQAILRLPQVTMSFRRLYIFARASADGHSLDSLNAFASPDPALFRRADRPLVVAGRLPGPGASLAVAINELAADKLHLRVGDTLHLHADSARQLAGGKLTSGLSTGSQPPAGPAYTVRVAAIIRLPSDVNAILPLAEKQDVSYEGQQSMYLTPAFVQRLAHDLGIPVQRLPTMNVFAVLLRHGAADWPAFAAAVHAESHGAADVQAGDYLGAQVAAASAGRGIHLEVVALIVFGVLAAVVTLLLAGQAFSRQVERERHDYTILRGLGATRAQLFGVVLLRGGVLAATGSALAVAVAVLGSPLMPLGLARQAEIHPGVEVNPAILVPGFAALLLLVVAGSAAPAWRIARGVPSAAGDDGHPQPSRLAAALVRVSAPPAVVVGMPFGMGRGRGPTGIPVASALVGAVAALAALSASLTFGASLGHLLATPRQQGWNWDAMVGNPNDSVDREAAAGALLAHNRLIASYSAIADLGDTTIEGVPVPAVLGIDPLRGSVYPPLLQGRAPQALDEIVLGTATLRELHRQVGQTVHISTPAGAVTMHIVGRMIVPSVGDIFPNGMGEGAWVSGKLVHLVMAEASSPNGPPPPMFVLFVVRYAPGAQPTAAFASLRRDFGQTVLRQLPSDDAINLASVTSLPFVLAGLAVLLGIATVGNTLIISIRRRRHDLAVLKAIGFLRWQVAAAVACEATSLIVVGSAIGLLLGVAAGRWAWSLVASGIDAASPPLVPVLAIAVIVPTSVAVGNIIAAWPARTAARVAPALQLRSE